MKLKTSSIVAIVVFCILFVGLGTIARPQITVLRESLRPTPTLYVDSNSPFAGSMLNSIPTVPRSYLRYRVIGASAVTFYIEYKYEDSHYDYAHSVEMGHKTSGDLYLEPPPERTKVEIRVTAMSDKGKMSVPYVITNKQWWDSVARTQNAYAMQHWFIILF